MAQETCQYCGDALVIETDEGFRCIGCGKETDDDDDGKTANRKPCFRNKNSIVFVTLGNTLHKVQFSAKR